MDCGLQPKMQAISVELNALWTLGLVTFLTIRAHARIPKAFSSLDFRSLKCETS